MLWFGSDASYRLVIAFVLVEQMTQEEPVNHTRLIGLHLVTRKIAFHSTELCEWNLSDTFITKEETILLWGGTNSEDHIWIYSAFLWMNMRTVSSGTAETVQAAQEMQVSACRSRAECLRGSLHHMPTPVCQTRDKTDNLSGFFFCCESAECLN